MELKNIPETGRCVQVGCAVSMAALFLFWIRGESPRQGCDPLIPSRRRARCPELPTVREGVFPRLLQLHDLNHEGHSGRRRESGWEERLGVVVSRDRRDARVKGIAHGRWLG